MGRNSGIGLATALYLHRPQYNNHVVALDRSPQPPVLPDLTTSPRYRYLPCDVLSSTAQRHAFATAAATCEGRGIDCVFINAGIAESGEQIWTDSYDDHGQLREPHRATTSTSTFEPSATASNWPCITSAMMGKGPGGGRGAVLS